MTDPAREILAQSEVLCFDGRSLAVELVATAGEVSSLAMLTTMDNQMERRGLTPDHLLVARFALEHAATPFRWSQIRYPDGRQLRSDDFTRIVGSKEAGAREGLRTYLDRIYGEKNVWRKQGPEHVLGTTGEKVKSITQEKEAAKTDPLDALELDSSKRVVMEAARVVMTAQHDAGIETCGWRDLMDLIRSDLRDRKNLHLTWQAVEEALRPTLRHLNNLPYLPSMPLEKSGSGEESVRMDPALELRVKRRAANSGAEAGKKRIELLWEMGDKMDYLQLIDLLEAHGLREVYPDMTWATAEAKLVINGVARQMEPGLAQLVSLIRERDGTEVSDVELAQEVSPIHWHEDETLRSFKMWAALSVAQLNLFAPVIKHSAFFPDKDGVPPDHTFAYNAEGSWDAVLAVAPSHNAVPRDYRDIRTLRPRQRERQVYQSFDRQGGGGRRTDKEWRKRNKKKR